jgi:hypothetical protein
MIKRSPGAAGCDRSRPASRRRANLRTRSRSGRRADWPVDGPQTVSGYGAPVRVIAAGALVGRPGHGRQAREMQSDVRLRHRAWVHPPDTGSQASTVQAVPSSQLTGALLQTGPAGPERSVCRRCNGCRRHEAPAMEATRTRRPCRCRRCRNCRHHTDRRIDARRRRITGRRCEPIAIGTLGIAMAGRN